MRVLIVEDEVDLGESLAEGLGAEGHHVTLVHDGVSALGHVQHSSTDVMVLDRDLPILDGDTVCRTLQSLGSPVRVLMLTAAAALDDRVNGLRLGADDYLTKPFAYAELVARVEALGRRIEHPGRARVYGDLTVDLGTERVTRAGRPVRLSPKEYAVLRALVVADGGLLTYAGLMERAWDDDLDTSRGAVKAVVHALRGKLGVPGLIVAEHGRGYRIEAPA